MVKVKFYEENHQYILEKEDGSKVELLSVTQLLKKHNITPDYSKVEESVLKAKAARGSVVHEEIENFIKKGEIGFTEELDQFISKCKKHTIKPLMSEFIVHNEEIAGTVDVAGLVGEDEQPFIGDFKTTVTLHKEAVAWQLSLYAYLHKETKFKKFLCFHFPDEKTCKVVEIDPIPVEEIEELLRCERECELYQKKTLELSVQDAEKIVAVQSALKALDEQKKELESQENKLKEFLISKFEETGLDSIDNEYFRIKYTPPSTRETIDTKKLKQEMPELAEKYTTVSAVKAKVTITLRGM